METIKDVKLVRITNSCSYPLVLDIEGERYRFKIAPVDEEKKENFDVSHWKYLFSSVTNYKDEYFRSLYLICQNVNPKNPRFYIKGYYYNKRQKNYETGWVQYLNFKVDNNSKFVEGNIIERSNYAVTYYFKFQNGDKYETHTVKINYNANEENRETVETFKE